MFRSRKKQLRSKLKSKSQDVLKNADSIICPLHTLRADLNAVDIQNVIAIGTYKAKTTEPLENFINNLGFKE